jgi:hypothetical protein
MSIINKIEEHKFIHISKIKALYDAELITEIEYKKDVYAIRFWAERMKKSINNISK